MDTKLTWLDKYFTGFALLVLFAGCLGLYLPALNSGFFLDDSTSIRTESLMLQPNIWPIYEKFGLRFIGYLSFWANYQLSGEDPEAFRATNIAIHALNGVLVYVLSRQLLALSSKSGSNVGAEGSIGEPANHNLAVKWVALGVALLFVVHPLQTQAVTYIVQRLASLMTLFYLGALVAWLQVATARERISCLVWLTIFLFSAVLASFTKQNAFSLPLVLVALELLMLRRLSSRSWLVLLMLGAIGTFVIAAFDPSLVTAVDQMTRETTAISRWEYLQHQWVILWLYLGKVVWPYPQVLDYGLSLNAFSTWQVVASGLAHLGVLLGALFVARRHTLITFGVAFFYLTHSVESGIVPIRDLVFEHRNYLPLVGLFLAVGAVAQRLLTTQTAVARWLPWLSLSALLFFAQATAIRNEAWADQETLLRQDVAYNPENTRALYSLAVWLQRNGRNQEAVEVLQNLFEKNVDDVNEVHITLLITLLIESEQYMEAFEFAEKILSFNLRPKLRGDYLRLVAASITGMGIDFLAADVFEMSMKFAPLNYEGGVTYAYSLVQLRRFAAAKRVIDQLETRFGLQPRLALLKAQLPRE